MRIGKRIKFGKRRRLQQKALHNMFKPVVYKTFKLDSEFKNHVLDEIRNPEMHELEKPAEICGTFDIEWDEGGGEYVLKHNNVKPGKNTKNVGELTVERGGVEDGVQFCHPKRYVHNVLWHTHPRGIPAYPSGSDVFITVINDCTGGLSHTESTAQTFVEFLFTEHGFWVVHRNVYENGQIASALDFTETRGKPIRMKNKRMIQVKNIRENIDTLIDILEQRLISHHRRNKVPNSSIVEDIQNFVNTNMDFEIIHNRLKINFYPWETERITLPEILFTTKVEGICIAH
jgi:hypothetical protein